MPKVSETIPKGLKPFIFFGVPISPRGGEDEAIGECPLCGREKKFYVAQDTGLWDCLTGDTQILTRTGYKKIGDLAGSCVQLLSHQGWRHAPILSGGIREVYAVHMVRDRHEKTIYATAGHRWILKDGSETTTKDLIPGARLASVIAPAVYNADPDGIRHGIMYGDGTGYNIELWGKKRPLLKYLNSTSVHEMTLDSGVQGLLVNGQSRAYKLLPTHDCTDEYLLGFLQGYFATDGTSTMSQRAIDSSNKNGLEFVREAAARVGLVTSPVGSYWRKGFEGYEGYLHRVQFHRSTLYPDFFIRDDQRETFLEAGNYGGSGRLSWRVTKIEPAGKQEVFCAIVPRAGTFALEDNLLTGNCKICGAAGNPLQFLRLLYEQAQGFSDSVDYSALAKHRKLKETTLREWGVVRSPIDDCWLVPGWGSDGALRQLYKYSVGPGGRWVLYVSPVQGTKEGEINHQLFGCPPFDKEKALYIAEGPWDGMALYETLRSCTQRDNKLVPTTKMEESLLEEVTVIAVPSANVWSDYWSELAGGTDVFLLYDNDHPREHPQSKKRIDPTGYHGMQKVAQKLLGAEKPPSSISFLRWGKEGEDHCPDLPHGYDIRDHLTQPIPSGIGPAGAVVWRPKLLRSLLDKLVPIPASWTEGRGKITVKEGQSDISCLPCYKWKDLQNAFRVAMRWTKGLDRSLIAMLSCIVSTRMVGDQLWLRVMGPPACGKSTLCEALAVNKNYTFSKSTLRGFHSGYKIDKGGETDSSLLSLLKNKTLITKDGDTLLQAPNLGQILSEARDIYDRVSRVHYRHGLSRDYEGISVTWILCGTDSLYKLDSSELGERFLSVRIMNKIDEDEEDEVGWRVALRTERELGLIADGKMESRDGPDMVLAKQLTGGYIDFLCNNAHTLVTAVNMPHTALHICQRLATFAAYMRARPPKNQEESQQRELCYRLVAQMVRLAKCIAVVLNKKWVDDEVLAMVRAVAIDTASGRTLELVRWLYKEGQNGADTKTLAGYTGYTEEGERKLLGFLHRISAVEFFVKKLGHGMTTRPKWRLTDRLTELYEDVFPEDKPTEVDESE